MHTHLPRVSQFLEEIKKVCKQTGCMMVIENNQLTVVKAEAPKIDDHLANVLKHHRETINPPAVKEDPKPAAQPKLAKSKVKPATSNMPAD